MHLKFDCKVGTSSLHAETVGREVLEMQQAKEAAEPEVDAKARLWHRCLDYPKPATSIWGKALRQWSPRAFTVKLGSLKTATHRFLLSLLTSQEVEWARGVAIQLNEVRWRYDRFAKPKRKHFLMGI